MKRRHAACAGAALLVLLAARESRGAPARFASEALRGGRTVPSHASLSGDPSDAAAASRRSEILRSPYLLIADERQVRPGLKMAFERAVPDETRARAAQAAVDMLAALESEDFSRVGSDRAPLTVVVTGQPGGPSVAGWDGREAGSLLRPVVAAAAGGRSPFDVGFDVARQVALLSLRQSAPDASAWSVEGIAEYLARRRFGLDDDPLAANDPLLAEAGSLTDPAVLAEFLPLLVRRLPHGVGDLRAAWEDSGSRRGDQSEPMLRALCARADARGVGGLLGDLLVRRLSRTSVDDPVPGGRRLLSNLLATPTPAPLGWRRITYRSADEGGGIEIALPEGASCAAGRVVIGYRGDGDEFDAVDLLPGVPRRVPLSGTARLGLLLVDGGEPGEMVLELRRLADYPAALVASSAEWRGGAVRLAWRTSGHRDLLAWIVTRVDETEGEGRDPRRRLVPTTESDAAGFSYQLDDDDVVSGHRYRYRVCALTTDGILSEAFDAPVLAGR